MSLITLKDFAKMREGKPMEKGVLVMDGDWLVYQSLAATVS